MKTLTYISKIRIPLMITVLFGTGIISLYAASSAGGPEYLNPARSENLFLAPKTPVEADFNESEASLFDFSILVPVTPKEADFNDDDFLGPVTPKEASFEDDDPTEIVIY